MKKTLMCATAAAALAGTGFIAQADDGWYGRADLGAVYDGKFDHDAEAGVPFTLGGDSEPDDALLGSLGVGYGFGNGVRLETALTYRDGKLDVSDGINGTGIPADVFGTNDRVIYSAHKDGSVQIWDLMVNALYDFNRDGNVNPYVGFGLGAAQISADARNIAAVSTDGNGNPLQVFGANGFMDDETGLALQGLAGVGFDLTEKLTLDAGYRMFTIQDLTFTGTNEIGAGVSYDADYTDHSFTLGLRYAFGATPPPPPPPAPAAPAGSGVPSKTRVRWPRNENAPERDRGREQTECQTQPQRAQTQDARPAAHSVGCPGRCAPAFRCGSASPIRRESGRRFAWLESPRRGGYSTP